MEYIVYVLLLLSLIILFIVLKDKKKLTEENLNLKEKSLEEIKTYFRKEWEEEENQLIQKKKDKLNAIEKECLTHEFVVKEQINKLDFQIKNLETQLIEKEKRYNEVNQDLDLYRQGKIKEIDSTATEYEQRKRLLVDASIVQYRELRNKLYNEELSSMQTQKETLENEIKTIKSELEEERIKRAAINEEIRKEEEKENYIQIHSIQLSDYDKEDIHFLLSLDNELHNKTILYKLIWSQYLQQGFKNMLHNIFGNRDPRNVIYCIENIKTGKKYIGKTSAEVSKRWTEHIKTSLNIGTIKSTNIHKALYKHWDEFIFYILEEVPQTKNLSEQEKYYIEFYESNKYGYNIKAGG